MKNLSISKSKVSCVTSNSEKVKKIIVNGTQIFSADFSTVDNLALPGAYPQTFEGLDFESYTTCAATSYPPNPTCKRCFTEDNKWFYGTINKVDNSGSYNTKLYITWDDEKCFEETFPEHISVYTKVPKEKNEYELSNTCCYKNGKFEGYLAQSSLVSHFDVNLQLVNSDGTKCSLVNNKNITYCVGYYPRKCYVSLCQRRKYGKGMSCPEYILNETPFQYEDEGIGYPYSRTREKLHDEFTNTDVEDLYSNGWGYLDGHCSFFSTCDVTVCKNANLKVGDKVAMQFAITCVTFGTSPWCSTFGKKWYSGVSYEKDGYICPALIDCCMDTFSSTTIYCYKENAIISDNGSIYNYGCPIYLGGLDLNATYVGRCNAEKTPIGNAKLRFLCTYYGADYFDITDYINSLDFIPKGKDSYFCMKNPGVYCCSRWNSETERNESYRVTEGAVGCAYVNCSYPLYRLQLRLALLDRDCVHRFGNNACASVACNLTADYCYYADTSKSSKSCKTCYYYPVNADYICIPLIVCSCGTTKVRAPAGYYKNGDIAPIAVSFCTFTACKPVYMCTPAAYTCNKFCRAEVWPGYYTDEKGNICRDKIFSCYCVCSDNYY